MRWLGNSVRVRLTCAVTLVFGLALSLSAWGLVQRLEATLIADVQSRNDAVAQAVGERLAADPSAVTLTGSAIVEGLPDNYDRDLIAQGLNESVVYVDGEGVSMFDESEVAPSLFDRIRSVVTGQATPLFGKALPSDTDQERSVVSQVDVPTPQGNLRLHVASSLQPTLATVDRVSNSLVIAVPMFIVAVGLMAWFMTGRTLRPVSAIINQVNEITGSTLDQRVPVPETRDEIGELARTMNAMLDRLQSSQDRQQQFVSDASHEFRSPVAAIRTQVETALLHPDTADWKSIGETVLVEDHRLAALVDDMLALARISEGVQGPRTDVDLDEIIHDHTVRRPEITVDRRRVVAGRVCGVRDELTSVVRNLIDNAVRHANSQVRVSLHTTGSGEAVRFSVEDDGPGIPSHLRAEVFERFSRLEEARSRDAGGSGLGLALTKRIVESHGGLIWVDDSELGGAGFHVQLPAAGASDD